MLRFALLLIASLSLCASAAAQTVPNPKLSPEDLGAAQSVAAAGGEGAELTYAARIDAVEKGRFDSLVVIFAKPAPSGKEYYATVVRGENRYALKLDDAGRALKPGDRFLRMGLRHAEGKAPVVRLIAATKNEAGRGEMQRNLDYQFDGKQFALIAQTLSPLAK